MRGLLLGCFQGARYDPRHTYEGRCLKNWLRRLFGDRTERPSSDAPAVGQPSSRVELSEMRLVLGRAMMHLDPDMRAVLVLRDMQDLEYQSIAHSLEIPIGTVKSRLFRARLALRAAVEGELGQAKVSDHD